MANQKSFANDPRRSSPAGWGQHPTTLTQKTQKVLNWLKYYKTFLVAFMPLVVLFVLSFDWVNATKIVNNAEKWFMAIATGVNY